jgi:hypothetical protein
MWQNWLVLARIALLESETYAENAEPIDELADARTSRQTFHCTSDNTTMQPGSHRFNILAAHTTEKLKRIARDSMSSATP